MTTRSLKDVRAFLLDMDGTLYVDEKLIPGALDLVEWLRREQRPHLFLTNNSAARGSTYGARLRRLGVPAEDRDILTSGEATAIWIREHTPCRRPLLLGTPSLYDEFTEAGFTPLDADGRDPDGVVVGFDMTLTYARLTRACLLVAAGLPYFATHPDFTCITAEGLIPDTGAILAAIESVTHRHPRVIGKPEKEMVEAALFRLGATAGETAMIGDQLDTDQTMANRAGLYGVLVLTGETSRQKLEAQTQVQPDLVVSSVAEVIARLRA